ncbi:hypothetical protein GCM10023169_18210 [Georgenia halophila]|uniref:DUF1648 domain-containing protein n=1 Tax=Georgenia halophila TaxID=620889 RepID=A0ABP8L6E8_9MICO
MSPTSTSGGRNRLPHRRRAVLFGVVLPVLVTTVAWILISRWIPQLPEQVAVHWGPDGVDRVGSASALLVPLAVSSGLSLLIFAVLSLTVGRTSFNRRMVLGLASGMAVFWAGMALSMVSVQRGPAVEAAADVPVPDVPLSLTVVAAIALGAAAGALAGSDPALPARDAVSGTTATLAKDERAVWIRTVGPSRALQRWGGIGAVLYVGFSAWLALTTGSWFVGILMVIWLPLPLTMLVWTVQVDSGGLTAKGTFGRPRQHVPAAEVLSATTTQVRPLPEWGGWGLRSSPSLDGGVGVVVRAGEGIDVARTGGRRLVVTVDDAATGAALLNTFAERARRQD